MSAPLPARPEAILRRALGDTPVAAAIVGDLREEYGLRPPGRVRTAGYWIACLSIAMRYAPGTVADALRVDFQHAARALRRARTFTITTTLTLTLGIATVATMLTVAYGALGAPLPFADPDALVRWGQTPIGGTAVNSTAVGNFVDLRARARLFEDLAAEMLVAVNLSTSAATDRQLASSVTANYFDVLGVRPIAGRGFAESDDREGAPSVALIGEGLWRRLFQASPAVLGEVVRIDTVPYQVIGVMPRDVSLPGDPQIWTTFRWSPEARTVRNRRNIEPIGRLRAGVSIDQGRDELRALFSGLAEAHPSENGKSTIAVMPYSDWLLGRSGPHRALLPLLAAAAGVLLLIAMLNATNLAIGRAESRRHEHVLRGVLGASAIRQMSARFLEAALLALPSGAMGALLAFWAIPIVIARYGDSIPRAQTIAPGPFTLAVAALAASAAVLALAFGASPARSRERGLSSLNRRTMSRAPRLRRRLVVFQVGLAAGLVYGALLLGSTIAALARVDLGVPLDRTLTFAVGVPADRYRSPALVRGFFTELEDAVRSLPGVLHVGSSSRAPFAGGTNGAVSSVDDPSRTEPLAEWRTVTPGLFAALGLRIAEGRGFEDATGETVRGAVLSESLARFLFGDRPATGRQVVMGDGPPHVVTGVASDLRDFGPTRPARPTIYVRHGSDAGFASMPAMTIVVRSTGDPMSLLPAVRDRLRAIDPDVALQRAATLETLAHRSFGTSRTTAAAIVVCFAGIALVLGGVGVFGVVAVGVEQRTREFGVRLAMGDTPRGILRRVLGDGVRLAVMGATAGGASVWAVERLVSSFVVEAVAPRQTVTIAGVLAILVASALVAAAVPARRAARLSPTDALRAE